MGSFKLEKGGSAKEQARGAGALAMTIGLVAGFVVHPIGFLIALLGFVFLIASLAASE